MGDLSHSCYSMLQTKEKALQITVSKAITVKVTTQKVEVKVTQEEEIPFEIQVCLIAFIFANNEIRVSHVSLKIEFM